MADVQHNTEVLDQKHEVFARNVALGCSLSEAARRAGYADSGAANYGSRLSKLPAVQRRIEFIRKTADPANSLASKEWVLCEVIDNHHRARKLNDINTSRQCLELVARLQGYLVEQRNSTSVSVRYDLSNPEQLRAAISQQLQGLPSSDRSPLLELAPPELAEAIQAECEKEPEKE